jgi:hypothetical protein
MTLPSKMPGGRSMFASAILLEAGVLGLFVSLLLRSVWLPAFGGLIVGGLAVFAAHVVRMVRSPAPKPHSAPRIDFAVLHAAGAAVSLAMAAGMGIVLLVIPTSPNSLHLAAAYGVFGLVGFLAQMVVGMETRLLPLVTWYWAYERSGFRVPPAAPLTMRDGTLQAIVFAGWTIGVPALAAGMFFEAAPLVSTGAWSLFAAVATSTLDNVGVLTRLRRQHPQADQTHWPITAAKARLRTATNARTLAAASAEPRTETSPRSSSTLSRPGSVGSRSQARPIVSGAAADS